MAVLSNAEVIEGAGDYPAVNLYRELVAIYTHNRLCDAYGVDRDGVNGGTHWSEIVRLAIEHGDIDLETMSLT